MATIKVACPKCGQKVSGDESFYGTIVECPICSADILFPGLRRQEARRALPSPVPPEPPKESSLPPSLPSEERATTPGAPSDIGSFPQGGKEGGDVVRAEKSIQPVVSKPTDEEGVGPLLPPSPIFGAISIVSAVLGVVTCVGGILFAPIAIIFGHTALAKARHSIVQPAPGHTLGAIGLMIGYVSLVLTILVLLALTFFGDAIREAFLQAKD